MTIASCAGRRHRFSKLGRDGTGKGNIEAVADDLVWGVLYELDAGQLERLVAIEAGYQRIEIEVELEVIGQVRTLSFEALERHDGLTPTREYLDHYVRGIREHGIPDAYLAALLGDLPELSSG